MTLVFDRQLGCITNKIESSVHPWTIRGLTLKLKSEKTESATVLSLKKLNHQLCDVPLEVVASLSCCCRPLLCALRIRTSPANLTQISLHGYRQLDKDQLYADKDGIATAESQQTFPSGRLQTTVLSISSLAGASLALSSAICEDSGRSNSSSSRMH